MYRISIPILFAILAGSSSAKSDSTLLKKVRDEYPSALSKLKTGYSTLEATGRLVQGEIEPPTGRGNLLNISVKDRQRKAVMRLFEGGRTSNKLIREVVYCVGNKATFTARKNLEQKRFMVSDLKLLEGGVNKITLDDSEGGFSMFAGQYAYAPFSINGIDNSEFFDQKKYRLIDANPVESNGKQLIRLQYRNITSQENKESVTGEIDFDPARGWVVTKHKMTGTVKVANRPDVKQTDYTMIVSIEYSDEPDKF